MGRLGRFRVSRYLSVDKAFCEKIFRFLDKIAAFFYKKLIFDHLRLHLRYMRFVLLQYICDYDSIKLV